MVVSDRAMPRDIGPERTSASDKTVSARVETKVRMGLNYSIPDVFDLIQRK